MRAALKWNVRYLAYARAHGRTPEAMLEHDERRFTGGKMIGFINWLGQARRGFAEEHPEQVSAEGIRDRRAFDCYLLRLASVAELQLRRERERSAA